MLYELKIGWKSFMFNSAAEAAKVMDLLDKAISVDTTYDGAINKLQYYHSDASITLERRELAIMNIHDNMEAAAAVVAQHQQEKEEQDTLQQRNNES